MKCLMGYCSTICSSGYITVQYCFRIAFDLKLRKPKATPQPVVFFKLREFW